MAEENRAHRELLPGEKTVRPAVRASVFEQTGSADRHHPRKFALCFVLGLMADS
jgi:hypothetical protein